ncbi:hypothetical protein KSP35_15040 [Aquihabitans sp. G128]|uniref:hypothetical protein n=1 Tax=Aquihabitans sp. G128 TaxID=2849779 RepID=UPI001C22874E|nr:hypothetical protein [Aquihabitans sp. G128]QXC59691.1 hypothetical protein KSP35_15040 [Aquihabitans sp. G128]
MTVVGTGTAGVRLGVSGHRAHAADPQATEAFGRTVLDRAGPVGVVVTSLAEGADRLFARLAAERDGWGVEVVLPLDAADYEDDFAAEGSIAEFRSLLAAATTVDRVPAQPTRREAYLAAGLAVLDRADALAVVWDGEPARGRGGTGEIVAEARLRRLPLAWIHVSRRAPVDPEPPGPVASPGPDPGAPAPALTWERWP